MEYNRNFYKIENDDSVMKNKVLKCFSSFFCPLFLGVSIIHNSINNATDLRNLSEKIQQLNPTLYCP